VTIRTWVSQVRSRLIRFEYEVVDTEGGEVFVVGFSTHISLDRDGKLARIPEEWRRFWSGLSPAGS
jgi:acyl-CoA thioesterase FadM